MTRDKRRCFRLLLLPAALMTDPNRICCQKRWFQTKIHYPDANGTIKRSCRSVQAKFSCPQSVSNEQPRCRFTSSCTSPSANQSCVGLYEKDFVFLRHARLRTMIKFLANHGVSFAFYFDDPDG